MIWKKQQGALTCLLLAVAASGAQGQPPSVTAQALSDDTIRVNFPDFSGAQGCFSGPQVIRFLNDTQNNSDSLNLGTTSVTYSDLSGGEYYFRVTGCIPNGQGEPDFETGVSNTVTIAGSQIPSPSTPATISTSATDDTTIAVTWSSSANATEYRIGVRSQPVDGWTPGVADNWGNWSGYSSVGSATSKNYSDLTPAIYQHRIVACNAAGCSTPIQGEAVAIDTPQFNGGDEYYLPDAKIRAIWTAPEGCLVLFENLPSACETKFSNAHALIQFENPNHEKMYSQVFMANAMGKKIDVWYDDNGDCDSLNTLMTIGRIETSAAQEGSL